MKLVDDASNALKWHSTWMAGLLAVAPWAWAQMPVDLKEQVPDTWLPYISAVMFAGFMAGRLRKQ